MIIGNEPLDLRLRIISKEYKTLCCLHSSQMNKVISTCTEYSIPYHLMTADTDEIKPGLNVLLSNFPE